MNPTTPMTDAEIDELRGTGLAAPVIARLVARIDAEARRRSNLNDEAEGLNKLVITLRETRQQDAAKIAKLKRALEAGVARLREMAADYDRMGLSEYQAAPQRNTASIIRSADLINAALHVEAAQQKALERP